MGSDVTGVYLHHGLERVLGDHDRGALGTGGNNLTDRQCHWKSRGSEGFCLQHQRWTVFASTRYRRWSPTSEFRAVEGQPLPQSPSR